MRFWSECARRAAEQSMGVTFSGPWSRLFWPEWAAAGMITAAVRRKLGEALAAGRDGSGPIV
eukprot:9620945-Heterocapsa_arctica.AAC.1